MSTEVVKSDGADAILAKADAMKKQGSRKKMKENAGQAVGTVVRTAVNGAVLVETTALVGRHTGVLNGELCDKLLIPSDWASDKIFEILSRSESASEMLTTLPEQVTDVPTILGLVVLHQLMKRAKLTKNKIEAILNGGASFVLAFGLFEKMTNDVPGDLDILADGTENIMALADSTQAGDLRVMVAGAVAFVASSIYAHTFLKGARGK